MRKFTYDFFNSIDTPTFVLSNVYHHHDGVITNVDKDSINVKFNMSSAQEVSFDVYKEMDGKKCEQWDKIHSLRYVYIPEHEEYYVISESIDEDASTVKHITLSSAGEWELSNRIIVNLEINTESDINQNDYEETILWNPDNFKASLLNRALKDKAPDWTVGYVDPKLAVKQRVFSVNNQSIYDFFTKTVAQELDCLFVFDSVNRTISVYDLLNTCGNCGERGEFLDSCPKCHSTNIVYGCGTDSNVYISYENYAQKISITDSGTSSKNCFTVIGGDDDYNAAIRNMNPTGTNYLYMFSEADYADMPSDLRTRLKAYNAKYDELLPTFQGYSQAYYAAVNDYYYYKTSMMPRANLEKWERNKGYDVGDGVYVSTLPTWCFLECTKAGVSGTTEFDATTVTSGQKITDGTVEWTVNKSIITIPSARQSANNIIAYFTKNPSWRIDSINSELEELQEGGNVNLTNRPYINTNELRKVGWKEVERNGIATVYTSTFSNEKKTRFYNFTPVVVNKTTGAYIRCMSPAQLTTYAESVIAGETTDTLNCQIGTYFSNVKDAEAAAVEIHDLHDEKYKLSNSSGNNLLFLDEIPTYTEGGQTVISEVEVTNQIEKISALQINSLMKANVISSTITGGKTGGTWRGTMEVYNTGNADDKCTTEEFTITLAVVATLEDYEKYMRYQVEKSVDNMEKTYTAVYEIEDLNDFKNEVKKYSLDELTNILKIYDDALNVLQEQGISEDGKKYLNWNVYNAVYKPTKQRRDYVETILKQREKQVAAKEKTMNQKKEQMENINKQLNLADWLGESLYRTFFNYIREGSYSNSNYVSTGLSDGQLLNSVKEILGKAEIELQKSTTLQYTLTDSLSNLLNTSEFKAFKNKFELGDYIICRADDNLYRLRLIQVGYAYSNPSDLSVTFSNVTRLGNYFSDAQDVISKAHSMTTSYDFVRKQVDKNTGTTKEFNDWKKNGINTGDSYIRNNGYGEIEINKQGILARQYDDLKGDYMPEQMKISYNMIALTKDNWTTTSAAIGKQTIRYYDKSTKQVETKTDYGVKADYIDSGSIYGTDIVAGNIYSRNYNGTTQAGSHLDLDNGNFSLASGAIKGTYNDSTGKYAITISGNNVTVADNVNVEAANFTAGDGITITNKQIAAIPYTAGEGITIENHVISADGSGGQGLQYWTETEHEIYQDVEEVIPGGWDADDEYIADSRENYYWYYDIPAYDPKYTSKKSNNKKAICARVKGKTTDSNENTRVWTVWISTDLEALNFEPNYDNPDYDQTSYMSARIKYNTLDEYVTLNYLGKTWYVTAFRANTPRKDEFSHILMSPQYPLLDKVYRYENEHPLTLDAILPTMMKDILDASHLAVSSNSKTAIGVNQDWTFYSGYDYNNTITTSNATFKVNRDGKVYATDLMYGSGSSKTSLIAALAGKQNKLTAGANITISNNTISATNTTYTAGDNISITNDVISATDTTYTAGSGIIISDQNVISVSGGGTVVDVIVDDTSVVNPQTMIAEIDLTGKQDVLTAGINIDITGGVISATDTTYTGTGVISISNENVISADLSSKQDVLTAGDNITITGATISATDTTYTAGDNIIISAQNAISADLSSKQDVLTAGDYISIDSENVISADLSSKQNVLTAGSNITIENDTISAMSSNDYSGLEEKCGTWIDGKNLYRKVIVVDDSFANLAEDVNDLDIETLVNLDALITNNGVKTKASVSNCTLSLSNDTISGTGSGMINYLVLEYTKTTDIVTDLSLFVTDVMSKDTSDVEEDDYVIIDSTEAGLRRYKV